jgi:bifunctional oligoribonuclease and PAP phosphatase NrnA
VATHVRPDGDAAGSLLGLTFMLRRLGKEVHPFAQDPVPPNYHFLPGVQDIRCDRPEASLYDDAAFSWTAAIMNALGILWQRPIRPIPFLINIDHHVSSSPFGNVFWVESKRAARARCSTILPLRFNCLSIRK